MARARKYGWNGELPAKPLVGQAQIVMFGMSDKSMKTAKEWTEIIGPNLATRQDPYRVVLYYILGFKKSGCVATEDFDIDAITKNGGVKHAVTVSTASNVEEREVLHEPVDAQLSEMQEAVDACLAAAV